MTNETVFYAIPIILFMLMVVTKSYRKSISTAVITVSLVFAGYAYSYSHTSSFMIIAFAVLVNQLRAIINDNEDTWVKR